MAKPLTVPPLEALPLVTESDIEDRRGLVLIEAGEPQLEPLVRRLALDRLRELHDDGVTMDYIGRMYGVPGGSVREVEAELRRVERADRRRVEVSDRW